MIDYHVETRRIRFNGKVVDAVSGERNGATYCRVAGKYHILIGYNWHPDDGRCVPAEVRRELKRLMAMPADNARIAEALRIAMEYWEPNYRGDDGEIYMCYAADIACNLGELTDEDCDLLKKAIARRIWGYATLGGFLQDPMRFSERDAYSTEARIKFWNGWLAELENGNE